MKSRIFSTEFIVMVVLIIVGAYGWIMNLIGLIGLEPFVFSGKVIVSIIGILVPPVGSIMGLFVW